MSPTLPISDKNIHNLVSLSKFLLTVPIFFFKFCVFMLQSISIAKAVNPSETPVKEKHVRSILFKKKFKIF